MLVDKQNELMSDLLFTVHQHGGDDVTWKPPIPAKAIFILYPIAFRAEPSGIVWRNSIDRTGTSSIVIHTSNIVAERLAETEGLVNQILVHTPDLLLPFQWNRVPAPTYSLLLQTALKCGTKPTRCMTLHCWYRRGTVSLHPRNRT